MRHQTMSTATLLTFALALAACGGPNGEKVPIRKTLGPGGTVNSRGAKAGCLRLDETLKTVAGRTEGLILHTRNFELGRLTPEMAFVPSANEADRLTRTHRALEGPNAPALQVGASLSELTLTTPADRLLGIAAQKNCETVKMNTGAEYKVVAGGGPRTITLLNEALAEMRVYTESDSDLKIDILTLSKQKNCDGSTSEGLVERVSHRLAWGEAAGVVKLAPEYARLLNVAPVAPPAEKSAAAANPRARAKAAPTPAPVVDHVLPVFSFQTVLRQVPALAAKSVCTP